MSAAAKTKEWIDAIFTPLTSGANTLLGSTVTEEKTGPDNSGKRTTTIVIAILAVVTISVVAYVLLKPSNN